MNSICFFFFFFNDTATTEIYTLSLHDALPISAAGQKHAAEKAETKHEASAKAARARPAARAAAAKAHPRHVGAAKKRSEEHTSELQSRLHLVCRLLLEKKKDNFSTLPGAPTML